jgi:antitoxin PrlF
VRKVLGLGKRDKVIYRMTRTGEVQLVKAEPSPSEDSALSPFLALLDKRLASHPNKIVPYVSADAEGDLALVTGVKLG